MEYTKASQNKARFTMILAMLIFGTIGIARRYIPLPSSILALVRGTIGSIFLLIVVFCSGKKLSLKAIKANLVLLVVSGAFIGANWILLFEAYRYTSVATATLCYYLAPVFVILTAPLILKEKMTVRKLICAAIALMGMVFVSGVIGTGLNLSEMKGILFGIGAAILYACVVLMNQKIKNIGAYDKTIMQLGTAAITLLPYTLLTEDFSGIVLTKETVMLVLVVGILHTGIAYALYFGSMSSLSAQTVALFSYIDPVMAILLSALVLREPMGITGALGAVMILGSTLVSEIQIKRRVH